MPTSTMYFLTKIHFTIDIDSLVRHVSMKCWSPVNKGVFLYDFHDKECENILVISINISPLVIRYEYDQCMLHTFHFFESFSLELLMKLHKMSSWPNLIFTLLSYSPSYSLVRHISLQQSLSD